MKGHTVDINCDLGEGYPFDSRLMPLISSCNIACGGHAGDETTIKETILLAKKHGVKVGAHPSFPDKENFGRKIMDISLDKLGKSLIEQLSGFRKIAIQCGSAVHHVKPHGALYNLAAKDRAVAKCVVMATIVVYNKCYIFAPYGSILAKVALEENLTVIYEAFADRNYNDDLSLVSRKEANALLTDPEKVADQVLMMTREKQVVTVNNNKLPIKADTFCVHGDNPQALLLLKNLVLQLNENDIKIA